MSAAVYTAARMGLADSLTKDVERLTGRPPIPMDRFIHDTRAAWIPDQARLTMAAISRPVAVYRQDRSSESAVEKVPPDRLVGRPYA
jgi:hypothetical protein